MSDKIMIAKRVAKEILLYDYVNLGVGIPTMAANYVPKEKKMFLHSDNGVLGVGKYANEGEYDPSTIDVSKQCIKTIEGASFFGSELSFTMIRGGHIQIAVMGALEVSENGDIANWQIPNKLVKGIGGGMDITASIPNIIVATTHTNKNGQFKLKEHCSLPLTGEKCVSRIITELCVIDVKEKGFVLVEKQPDISIEYIQERTGAKIWVEDPVLEYQTAIQVTI